MSLISQIETILFVASKPLSLKKIAKSLDVAEAAVGEALLSIAGKYNTGDSGVMLLQNNDEWQMISNPDNRTAAEKFLKAEVSGELTRPQLETLTVISYCGPITKPELEQIRGVNCALIIRNLLMRGLVKENEDAANLLPTFEVTMDYLRHLGLSTLAELPDYETLHNHEYVMKILGTNPEELPQTQ
ncbi:MAG: SMC-Scp complex subunit ScpB [Candidatus Magasanikbacteria bacterium]|nr:SMC-Scp complex subunit ScpB [Candidatus Magasanikbacteria bacterium]